MTVIIKTPRPPLNLFEVVRVPITDVDTVVYEVPEYEIPANGPTPLQIVDAAAIMTGVAIANSMAVPITVGVQIIGVHGDAYSLVSDLEIPVGDFVLINVDRQVMKSGEVLQAKCSKGEVADVHFSFVLNQREQFEVLP